MAGACTQARSDLPVGPAAAGGGVDGDGREQDDRGPDGADCWPVNDAAIYGQEVEPPAHRQRLARGVPGGPGRSPDAADDADVVEMGGRRPRWPGGSTRGPAFSIAVAALVAGLLLGFIGGQVRYNNCTTDPAGQ